MKKYILGFGLFVFGLFFITNTAFASTIFSESFGSNSNGFDGDDINWNSWSDGGNSGDDAEIRTSSSGNDSASPDGGRFAVALGEDGYFCREINTTGFNNVKLSYNWRGDSDAENDDDGQVQYKVGNGSCSSSGFSTIQDHDLSVDGSWSTQSAFDLPNTLDNTVFKLKFKVNSSQSDEHFRVDGILITGDPIVVNGSITVYKDVLNPDSSAVVDGHWFGVKLNDANPQNISEFNSYTYANLVPGTYTVTETADGDYDFVSFSSDNDSETPGAQITVSSGANTNLTITNKQKKGSITVNKTVTNPNGGEAVAGNFYFSLNGGEAIQFIQDEMNSLFGTFTLPSVNPGAFSIAEVMIPSGNYAISYSGNCSGVLGSNDSKTCNITNSDIPEGKGAITIVKNVINDDGGIMTASDFPLYITPTESESMMAENGTSYFLDPGTYNVSEMMNESLSSKYMQTSLVCVNGETETNGQVVLSAQASWVCTITNNDKPAKLTIVKNLINNAWNPTLAETFTFSLSGQEDVSVTTSATEEGEVDATGQSEVIILNAGNYTLSENLLNNWSLTGMYCSGEEGSPTEEGNGLMLTLSNGEEVTCYFTNTRQTGTLTINKIVINDHEGTSDINDFPGFQINGGAIIPFYSGNEEESVMESQTTVILESGVQYDVTEPESSGYDRILENNCRDINVDAGLTFVCDITNNDNANNTGGSTGGDPTPFSPSSGGQVLGASTEAPATTEAPKEEMPKDEGMVLGEEIFIFLKNMRLGSRLAPDVSELQKRLTKEGFYSGPISGYFGPKTKEAVIKYQTKNSPLTPDGVVGPRTRGVLNGTSAPLPNSASI